MLVDSHCHLDYYTPMELPDVLARAAAAGVGEMVTIGTTLAQSDTLPALIEGYRQPLVHRRRAPASRGRGADPGTGSAGGDGAGIRASSASASPASTTSTTGRRATCRRRTSAPISAARDWRTCRCASTPATPTTISL